MNLRRCRKIRDALGVLFFVSLIAFKMPWLAGISFLGYLFFLGLSKQLRNHEKLSDTGIVVSSRL